MMWEFTEHRCRTVSYTHLDVYKRQLVEQLSKEGHDIIIIDKNAKKVQEIANIYDIMGIVGNGASYSVQMDAGIEDTDLIISVTESDELNLLCCTVAKQVGDCAAIARVRTPDYSKEAGYQMCIRDREYHINDRINKTKKTGARKAI